jgi:hypothetical protein
MSTIQMIQKPQSGLKLMVTNLAYVGFSKMNGGTLKETSLLAGSVPNY